MDFDNLLLEILDKYIDGKRVDIDEYCKKYPEYQDALLSKFKTAEFIKSNFHEEDLSGKQLGEYIILQELGRGGMGVVFLGIQPALSRLAAIKVLSPSFVADKDALQNFQEEAKIIAKFNHPNIVPIYSIRDEKGMYYIAMGYVSAHSLKSIIEIYKNNKELHKLKADAIREALQAPPINDTDISQKSITLKRGFKFWDRPYFQFIATIGAEIADALSYAHQNGIVHGDLKPSNILLTHEAIPMVVDFGLSRNIKKIASMKTSEFTGTLAYAAPEQVKENTINEKTDIWSLGITLYELLTFRNPFTSDTVKQTVNKISKGDIAPLRAYNKKIPIELEAIILKCLECNPAHRYASIADLSEDLNNYLTSKPTKARPIDPIRKTVKLFRRRPLLSFVTASLIFTLLISSALMFNKRISDLINDAKSTYENGHYDQALSKYDKIIKMIQQLPFNNWRYVEIFSGMADTYSYKGQYLNAIEYYKKALAMDPKYYWAIVGIAETYYEAGDFDKALKFYKQATAIRPTDRSNYYYVGKMYAAKKMWDEAINNYRRAIELTPEDDTETLREIASIVRILGISKKEEIEIYLKNRKFSDNHVNSIIKLLQ